MLAVAWPRPRLWALLPLFGRWSCPLTLILKQKAGTAGPKDQQREHVGCTCVGCGQWAGRSQKRLSGISLVPFHDYNVLLPIYD